MSTTRDEINRWGVVTALAATLGLLTWSIGVTLTPVATILGMTSRDDAALLRSQTDVSDSVFAALDSLTAAIERRTDQVIRLVPDKSAARAMTQRTRDSLVYVAYLAGIAAAKDSAAISALRAISLSTANAMVVHAAEELAGRERRGWNWFGRSMNFERTKTRPTPAQWDSVFQANEDLRIGLAGYEAASRRGMQDHRRQLIDLRDMLLRRRRLALLAAVTWPLALGLLLSLLQYGRTGSWSLPDALGLAKRPPTVASPVDATSDDAVAPVGVGARLPNER